MSASGITPTAACIQKPSHPRREKDKERLSFGDGLKALCRVRNTSEFPQHAVARYVSEWHRLSVVGLWGNLTPPRIAVSLLAHDWAGRLKLTEPDQNERAALRVTG